MKRRPYATEEVLSFYRMKRAVVRRVVEMAEKELEEGIPLDRDKLEQLTIEEWKAAKDAAWSSFDLSGKRLEYVKHNISQLLRGIIEEDRAELEALGVQDTPL
ncbi:hypothetical protein ACFLWX_02170 [Chloroflexota bacterium]